MKFDILDGPSPEAETVLLSSGLGGSAGYWAPQIEALRARFRVVTYDHRGCARTGGTVPEGTTIADMADDVLEVMQASGTPRAHFIGHALGGLMGLDLALREPDRIASLVLINAWSRADAHSGRCFDVRLALLRDTGVEAFLKAQPLFLYPAEWMARNAARLAEEEAHGIAHFQGAGNITRRIAALRAFDVDDRLAEVAAPVLIVASRDDMLVPWSRSVRLAEGIPGARLVLEPEGGHALNVTNPARFNRVIGDFFDGLGSVEAV
ncbi:pyrimidine utilization protein D [Sinirhodobacter populi]|uniref:Putative carbamate hydrolase RutD n=1 Tax=Paenirhodobacter populi TaxID=2306993 RepID=A0A443KEE6_9RHOB|nr:pyrimidine utilization protein D [Sinirhodobacter populi]RWR31168.1 pyrimidine utilization protein D [Sinirhodobacter populi]